MSEKLECHGIDIFRFELYLIWAEISLIHLDYSVVLNVKICRCSSGSYLSVDNASSRFSLCSFYQLQHSCYHIYQHDPFKNWIKNRK